MADKAPKGNEPEPTPAEPDPGILAASPQDPTPAAPEMVAVKVGDQEIQVDKATAALIDAQNAQFQAQLDELRKAPPAPAPAPEPAPAPGETDWEKLMLDDPAGFAQKIREDVTQELTGQYNARNAMSEFWSNFYDQNSDLKSHKAVVESVMNQNMGSLGDMRANDASTKLATMTRETIVGLVKQFGPKDSPQPSSQQRTTTEMGAGPPAAEPQPADNVTKIPTMTDALKQRRKDRRTARQGQKAGQSGTAA